MSQKKERENFGSRMGVILALAGSAIGLGNLWRFPYVVGQNGGAAFIVIYILSMIFISMPVFIAEVIIGRRSRRNAFQAMGRLSGGNKFWRGAGFLAVLIPTLIVSYYSVIGGWSSAFLLKAFSQPFALMDPDAASGVFGELSTGTLMPIVMHLLFLGISCAIVAGGVKSGIEKFSKYAIPTLFVMIVIVAVYSITLPGSKEGVQYLLNPDFSRLTARSFAYALGQSFFSLSLGMGIVITYGSYVSSDESILFSSSWTAVFDLMFAILAGLAIMPAVFAAGIEPAAGPGLIFQSIPFIFAKMGAEIPVLSVIMSVVFFLAVVIAAMTSCISLVEVGVAWLIERYHMKRRTAAKILFFVTGAFGSLCSLSFGVLSGIKVFGDNIFGATDNICSNILLMLMAFLSVLFVGFVMKKSDVKDEFTNSGRLAPSGKIFGVFYFLIKWVAPIAVLLIFFTNFML